MVLMAQPFSYRYPLIDGQGNFGSQDDPKSFAAMRYTESRLTPIAELLLEEVDQGTVDWTPNFDGTLKEPSWLPSRVPHVLLNGSTGIAVGMATDIPPHNLREVASACIRLLDEPEATIADLCEHVKGPDFPTAAEIITPANELAAMYTTGNGSVRCRACGRRRTATSSSPPCRTRCRRRRSSNRSPRRCARKTADDRGHPRRIGSRESDPHRAHAAQQPHRSRRDDAAPQRDDRSGKSYRVNLNMIGLDGKPQVKNLKQILSEWLRFRADTVTKRLQFRLAKVERRLHLLEGLRIAYLNLDEVIRIIRTEEEPKPALIARFKLSEEQADYILETRLRQLARLEEMKINAERDELEEERARINVVLNSKARLKTLLKDELRKDAEKYGDARRSPLVARGRAGARRNRARRQRAGHRDPFRKRLGARGERP
jgi:topoisomerase-4 subunit A